MVSVLDESGKFLLPGGGIVSCAKTIAETNNTADRLINFFISLVFTYFKIDVGLITHQNPKTERTELNTGASKVGVR